MGCIKQHKTSRNVKTLPHHDNLKSFGACFGVSGDTKGLWFALDGERTEYEYSYNIKIGIPQQSMKLITPLKMLVYLI